ncbi:MAG: hypothetical protein K2J80_08175 [Oscillospiraceae bacterium]|nr:hypothetical protein [Oscillospiraceae bacterium]
MGFLSSFGKRRDLLSDCEREEIAQRIGALTEQLEDVRANFNIVTDERTIDALIYEENALLCRIESLRCEARDRGITIQPFER